QRRTKQYVERLKSIELRKSAPGLNKRVAKAFVRNALWDPSAKRPREDMPVESTSAQSRDDSDVSYLWSGIPGCDLIPCWLDIEQVAHCKVT
ncbi:unnamed protein product, partial [Nippostrongylus brasiliensis]|uniref:Nuclear protein MDM1 n=1 Tax=Nippostrongylus brasiliensis TaxID=27835 RepID=A0A0N4XS99_NIPBR